MLASVRAGFAAALVALFHLHRLCRRQAVPAIRSRRQRDQARSPDQDRRRTGRQSPSRRCGARPILRCQRNDFRAGMQMLGADRRGRAATTAGELAAARPRDPADPPERRPRAHRLLLERAATAAYIAYQRSGNARRGGGRAGRCSAAPSRIARSGARRSMRCGSRSTCARSPRCAPDYEQLRERSRLPPARLHGRCRRGFAARLLPVLRGAARQAHRFLAVRRGRRQRQAGAHRPRTSSSASKACKHGERYAITLRAGLPSTVQGDAAEVGRLQHLCARPQAVRALHRQGLCAAAHRPARHSGGQRQHRRR